MRHTTRLDQSRSIEVSLAVTGADLDAASRLVHECYVRRGYAAPSADGRHTSPYHAAPSTAVFVARASATVVATVSLIADSARGLPCDLLWPSDLAALRADGGRVAEVSALAVSEAWRGRGLRALRPLVCAVGVYARDLAGLDTLCVAVHPRHASFYEALLQFRRFGALTACGAVNGAPAVGLSLDLAELDRELHEPFAASIFGGDRRRTTRAGLENTVRRSWLDARLKMLHSCAGRVGAAEAVGGGVTEMC